LVQLVFLVTWGLMFAYSQVQTYCDAGLQLRAL
jgi:hypothetical protein